jgi:hypothetical protein
MSNDPRAKDRAKGDRAAAPLRDLIKDGAVAAVGATADAAVGAMADAAVGAMADAAGVIAGTVASTMIATRMDGRLGPWRR